MGQLFVRHRAIERLAIDWGSLALFGKSGRFRGVGCGDWADFAALV